MKTLLTVLSVAAGWAFLGVLVAGLASILAPLQRVRRSLEQIAMGVRAIEQQTAPLGAQAGALATNLTGAGTGLGSIAGHLESADRHLNAVAPTLRAGRR